MRGVQRLVARARDFVTTGVVAVMRACFQVMVKRDVVKSKKLCACQVILHRIAFYKLTN